MNENELGENSPEDSELEKVRQDGAEEGERDLHSGDYDEAVTAEIELPDDALSETSLGMKSTAPLEAIVSRSGGWHRAFFRSLLSLLIPVVAGVGVTWWLVKDLPQEQLLDRGATMLSSGVAARNVADALGARVDVLRTLASQGAVLDQVSAKNAEYRGTNEVIRRIIQEVDNEWRTAFAGAMVPPRPVADNDGSRSLRSFASLFPGFVSLLATDQHGAATASIAVTPQFDYSADPWYENVLSSGQVEVTTVFDQHNRPLFRVALPMFEQVSRPAGVLRALLDPEAVLAPALDDLEAEGFKVMVVGRQGELLFRTRTGTSEAPIDASLLQLAVTDLAGATSTSMELADGSLVFASAAGVPRIANVDVGSQLGWKVILVREAEALSGLVVAQNEQRTRVLAVVAVVTLTLATLLALWLSRPFRRLARLPEIVGSHDWSRRVPVRGGVPGDLVLSINDLLRRTEQFEGQRVAHQAMVADTALLAEQVKRFVEGDHLTVFSAKEPKLGALVEALAKLRDDLSSRLVTIEDEVAKVCGHNDRCKEDVLWSEENESDIARSQKLKTMAGSLAAELEDLARQSNEVSDGLEQELRNLDDKTKGNSGQARREVRTARARHRESKAAVDRAGVHLAEVRDSVELLRDLSDRTSVLALNGSIQAALSGRAGRGFSIIASEVEQLSKQATELSGSTSRMLKALDAETVMVQKQLGELGDSLVATELRLEGASQAARDMFENGVGLRGTMSEVADRARGASQSSTALTLSLEKQDGALAVWRDRVAESSGRRRGVTDGLRDLLKLMRRMRSRERGLSLVPEKDGSDCEVSSNEEGSSRSAGNDL